MDEKNIMLEIRGGTGGDEAAIWAGDLFRMYMRYAQVRSLHRATLSLSLEKKGEESCGKIAIFHQLP